MTNGREPDSEPDLQSARSVTLSEESNDNRLFIALVALVIACVVGFVISVR